MPVKSKVEISQNFVVFSEYINFNYLKKSILFSVVCLKKLKKDRNTSIQLILMTIICTTVLYFHSFHNREGHKNVNKHVCSLQIMQLLAFQSPSLMGWSPLWWRIIFSWKPLRFIRLIYEKKYDSHQFGYQFSSLVGRN